MEGAVGVEGRAVIMQKALTGQDGVAGLREKA